jgi:hypothetical protein
VPGWNHVQPDRARLRGEPTELPGRHAVRSSGKRVRAERVVVPSGCHVEVITKTVTQTTTTQAGSGNGNIGSPNGPLAHCGHLLGVAFSNNKKTSLTQRYKGHDRVVIRGRLISCGASPQPIYGAKIDVVHVINGVRHVIKTGVKTRGLGRFTLIVPRNIRTRTIEFNYRGDLNKAAIVSSVSLHYTLRNSKGKTLK